MSRKAFGYSPRSGSMKMGKEKQALRVEAQRLAVEYGRSLAASGASGATGYSRAWGSGRLRFSLGGSAVARRREHGTGNAP